MRSLQVQVPLDRVAGVLALAAEHGAASPVALRAEAVRRRDGPVDGPWALVLLELPNERVGAFVEAAAREVENARYVLLPVGVLPLHPPPERVGERVRDVSRLSTLEVVVASLQSVGSWAGMLLYSVLAGIIGGYGLVFDVGYLLVAAMLINPMGAPALVSVVGLAIGDARIFARGAARFLVSLLVQALAALALGLGYGLGVATQMMEQVASLSAWAVVIAAAAGAAGAQAQVRSDRDSLVSGTAAGFMVAAALAPPAAVLGLSIALGRLDYTALMAFLLALQFLAITAGGWLVLHGFGLRPRQPGASRGARRWRNALAAAVVGLAAAFVTWQARMEPRFRKADLSRSALEIARDAVEGVPGLLLVEAAARFTRPELERHGAEGLLFEIHVERSPGAADGVAVDDDATAALRARIRELVELRMSGVVPFVDVTVLPASAGELRPRTGDGASPTQQRD